MRSIETIVTCLKMNNMLLSFHPLFEADVFRFCSDRDPEEKDIFLMKKAEAIILPQHRHKILYETATQFCQHVFPNYQSRYQYPGKVGDIQLFRRLGLPHPRTDLFDQVRCCPDAYWPDQNYPLVIKSNYGGEGQLVFLVQSPKEAKPILNMLKGMEKSGFKGFLVQEWIPSDNRTLRVVVMEDEFISYWRVQKKKNDFRHNLAVGAEIDYHSDLELQNKGVEVVKSLQEDTGINLAGIDILFSSKKAQKIAQPFLLEINYYFAREGLGGNDRYYQLLEETINAWIDKNRLSCSYVNL